MSKRWHELDPGEETCLPHSGGEVLALGGTGIFTRGCVARVFAKTVEGVYSGVKNIFEQVGEFTKTESVNSGNQRPCPSVRRPSALWGGSLALAVSLSFSWLGHPILLEHMKYF